MLAINTKHIVITLASLVLGVNQKNLHAQHSKDSDMQAIESMCGCFKVGFNFAETFNYSQDSNYMPSTIYTSGALEYVHIIDRQDNLINLQHTLVLGSAESPFIMKHWSQEWVYEGTDVYEYQSNNKWSRRSFNVDSINGQWTQKVYQVDDSPRYEGSASWIHIDGRSFWESTSYAPLPRREYTKRSDYNITLRRTRHELTSNGWIQDQDNDKIIRDSLGSNYVLAQEKGFNTYTRVDDSLCQAAADWWTKNDRFWSHVRDVWDRVFEENSNLTLKSSYNNQKLYEILFSIDPKTSKKEIKKIILNFVENDI